MLEQHGIGGGWLGIELTERNMVNLAELHPKLSRLRECGIFSAADDLGTERSNILGLVTLPVVHAKIDGVFVERMHCHKNELHAVQHLIRLAQSIKNECGRIKVVAERVENGAQVELLRKLGCDAFQGFYFARPMEAPEATALLRKGGVISRA